MMNRRHMNARLPVPGCFDCFNHKWEPTKEQVKLFEKWKGYCVGYLMSCTDGSNITQLLTALVDHTGEGVPLQKMGLGSVYLFLYEMADCIEIRRKMSPATARVELELIVLLRESAVPVHSQHVRNMELEKRGSEFERKLRRIREVTQYVPPMQLLMEHFNRKSTCEWFYNAGSNNYTYGGPTMPPYQYNQPRPGYFPRTPYPYRPPLRTPWDWTLSSYRMPGLGLLGPYPANTYLQFQNGPQQQRRQKGTVTTTSAASAFTMPEVDSRQAIPPLNNSHQPTKVSIISNVTTITEPGELIKRKPVTTKYTRQELLNQQSATAVREYEGPDADFKENESQSNIDPSLKISSIGKHDKWARAPPQKSTSAANPGTSVDAPEATSERNAGLRNASFTSGPIKLAPSTEHPKNGKPATLNFSGVDSAFTPTKVKVLPQVSFSKMEYSASRSEALLLQNTTKASLSGAVAVTTDSEATAATLSGKDAQVTELPPPAIKFDMDLKISRRHMVDCFPYATFNSKRERSEIKIPLLVSSRNVITLSLKAFMAGYMNHP